MKQCHETMENNKKIERKIEHDEMKRNKENGVRCCGLIQNIQMDFVPEKRANNHFHFPLLENNARRMRERAKKIEKDVIFGAITTEDQRR